jgi:hypothetical protein
MWQCFDLFGDALDTFVETPPIAAEVLNDPDHAGRQRLIGKPGSPEFLRSYNEAIASRRRPVEGNLFTLISEFRTSSEFSSLSDSTKRAYTAYLRMIEAEFGDMPIEALSDPEVRGEFKRWRDGMADTPRKADYAWTTLARVLSVAHDRGRIPVNPCQRGGRPMRLTERKRYGLKMILRGSLR